MKRLSLSHSIRMEWLAVVLILLVSLIVRQFAAQRVHFDSDEAIQGLMARHIFEGKSFPVMEYGSSHHGAFASYWISLVLWVGGTLDVGSLRIYANGVWLSASVPLFLIVRRQVGKTAAFFALAYYCFPPVSVLQTSVKAYPGQAEMQLILGWLFYFVFRIQSCISCSIWWYGIAGMAMGFLLWLTPAALPAIFLFIGFIGYRLVRFGSSGFAYLLVLGGGVAVGYAPGFLYLWGKQDGNLLSFLMQTAPTQQSASDIVSLLLIDGYGCFLGFQTSFRTPWGYSLLGILLYGILLIGGIRFCWKKAESCYGQEMFFFILLFFFFYTILLLIPRWNQSLMVSPRYLFPLLPALILLCCASLGENWKFDPLSKCLVVGVWFVWILSPYPGRLALDEVEGDRRLAAAIQERGITTLATDYWKAYKLVFLTQEKLIATPQAGPIVVDRYPIYTDIVYASPSPAYLLIPKYFNGYSPLVCFENYLIQNHISYRKESMHDMVLVWDLSRKVLPGETGMLRFGDNR